LRYGTSPRARQLSRTTHYYDSVNAKTTTVLRGYLHFATTVVKNQYYYSSREREINKLDSKERERRAARQITSFTPTTTDTSPTILSSHYCSR
jgi:hypothetical protein